MILCVKLKLIIVITKAMKNVYHKLDRFNKNQEKLISLPKMKRVRLKT